MVVVVMGMGEWARGARGRIDEERQDNQSTNRA